MLHKHPRSRARVTMFKHVAVPEAWDPSLFCIAEVLGHHGAKHMDGPEADPFSESD